MTATSAPAPVPSSRRARRVAARQPHAYNLLRLITIAAWLVVAVVFLRPTFLGGPTGYVIVSGTSMEPTFHTGDLIITTQHSTYHRGEIIAFRVPEPNPAAGALVIHRIVGTSADGGFITQGDNRDAVDSWHPRSDDIIGTRTFLVPGVGTAFGYLKGGAGLALLAGLGALIVMWPKTKDGTSPELAPIAWSAELASGSP